MKDQILLPEGTYYKANLHCHTTLSDGHPVERCVKEEYQKQGYSIIAYTDHRKYVHHTELDDENFLSLAALEVDVTEEPTENREWPVLKCYHLNLFDTNPAQEKPADLLPKFQQSSAASEPLHPADARIRLSGVLQPRLLVFAGLAGLQRAEGPVRHGNLQPRL